MRTLCATVCKCCPWAGPGHEHELRPSAHPSSLVIVGVLCARSLPAHAGASTGELPDVVGGEQTCAREHSVAGEEELGERLRDRPMQLLDRLCELALARTYKLLCVHVERTGTAGVLALKGIVSLGMLAGMGMPVSITVLRAHVWMWS